jgi:hypothetical protein
MKFYEIVNQVGALLQREGRVSYRALKREFDLDDEVLEDLKARSPRRIRSVLSEGYRDRSQATSEVPGTAGGDEFGPTAPTLSPESRNTCHATRFTHQTRRSTHHVSGDLCLVHRRI